MEEPKTKRAKVTASVPAAEVITFHLLRNTEAGPAIDADGSFPPEMTHQLFGEEEEIKGFDGLSIDIFVTPRLQPLVDVKYADRAAGATDLKQPFSSVFAAGFFDKKEDFDMALRQEQPLPLDKLGKQVAAVDIADEGSQFIVTFSNLSQATPELKELHARAQAFLYFFVDAASAIDSEDPQWDVYMALEKSQDGLELVGFCTVYKFYAYPDRCRMRLSQILVMPPHQGRGVGSLLLRAVYDHADAVNAVDVTFEDPSERLQRIRDKEDLKRMLRCEWLQEAGAHVVSTAMAVAAAARGEGECVDDVAAELALPPDYAARVQKELRISKQQVRRVWEALVLLLASPLPQKDKITGAVESMILRRLQNQVAAAKKDAAGKAVRDTETGFVMMRSKQHQQQEGAPAPSPALGGAPVEGVSAQEQEEAIEQAVEARMEELQQLVASFAK